MLEVGNNLHWYFFWELLACTCMSSFSAGCGFWLSTELVLEDSWILPSHAGWTLFCLCCSFPIHRNFHLRWSHSSNPPSEPEHLEGVSCETQLRFIYHPNPHRLLMLPAGCSLTALVVQCEKSGLTPIKQQSCPTDSSMHFLLVDLWVEKHGRKEIITGLPLFYLQLLQLLTLLLLLTWTDRDFAFAGERFFSTLSVTQKKLFKAVANSPLLRLVSLTSSWTWSQDDNPLMKWHTKTKAAGESNQMIPLRVDRKQVGLQSSYGHH